MNNLLAELVNYYDALAELDAVPRPGFEKRDISYDISIADDGTLLSIISHEHEEIVKCKGGKEGEEGKEGKKDKKKKFATIPMSVPQDNRTSGIHPFLAYDNASYIFGLEFKNNEVRRNDKKHESFVEFNKKILMKYSDNPAIKAVLAFFDKYTVDDFLENELLQDKPKAFYNHYLVFYTEAGYLHEQKEVREYWEEHFLNFSNEDAKNLPVQLDIVTGEPCIPCLTHPMIKGVPGTGGMGGKLISFNYASCRTGDYRQGENAPMSQLTAFKYGTALAYLLNPKNNHCKYFGDMVIVSWEKDRVDGENVDLINSIVTNTAYKLDVSKIVNDIFNGSRLDYELAEEQDNEFFILGLTGSKAVVCPKFFYTDTFNVFLKNIKRHYTDMAFGDPNPDYNKLSPLRIFNAATPEREKKAKEKGKPVSANQLKFAQHETDKLIASVINGTPYPYRLYIRMYDCINEQLVAYKGAYASEGEDTAPKPLVTRSQAAFVQAYLLRANKISKTQDGEIQFMDDTTNASYLIGRQAAIVEEMQYIGAKKYNKAISVPNLLYSLAHTPAQRYCELERKRSIAEGWFTRSPSGVINKLKKDYSALGAELAEILLRSSLPMNASYNEVNAFCLGYNYQRNRIFNDKAAAIAEKEKANENNNNEI